MAQETLLRLCVLMIAAAVPASSEGADNPAALDVRSLDGSWILQHYEWNGRQRPWSRGDVLAFDSKRQQLRWHVLDDNGKRVATDAYDFEVDLEAQPVEIDLRTGGRQLRGILKYADNTITICFGRERPAEFSTQPARRGYVTSVDDPRLIVLTRRQVK